MTVLAEYQVTTDSLYVEAGSGDSELRLVTNLAGGTLYYKAGRTVTSTSNDGSLTAGQSVTISTGTSFVSATRTNVTVENVTEAVAEARNESVVDVKDAYGAVGNGTIDDTTAIQAALTNAPTGSTVFFPPGAYKVSSTLSVTRQIRIVGSGLETDCRLIATSALTGQVINVSPSSTLHHVDIRDIAVDVTSAPTADGIRFNKVDDCQIVGVKVRCGRRGFDLADVGASTFDRCFAFNQTDAGFYFDGGSLKPIGIELHNCLVYQSSGATTDMAAGIDIRNGADITMSGTRAQRAPNTANKMPYGIAVRPASVPSRLDLVMVNCEFDGITDLSAGSTSSAAGFFQNCVNVKANNCWFSAYSASEDKPNAAVRIDAGTDFNFAHNWISGSNGVEFVNAPTRLTFTSNDFPNAAGGSSACYVIPSSNPPTKLQTAFSRYALGVLADSLPRWKTARPAAGPGTFALKSETADIWTPGRNGLLAASVAAPVASGSAAPTAGQGRYVKVYVPETMTFATTWVNVATAGTGGTALANCYVGLYDSAGNRLGVTADQSSAWATTGAKSAALVLDNGMSFTIVGGDGVYVWVAILVGTQSTTNVALSAAGTVGLSNINTTGATVLGGSTGSSLSALPSPTFTPSGLSASNLFWVGLS